MEGSQQFSVQGLYNKSRCLVLNSIVNIKRWLSEMVNVVFFCGLVQTQSEDALFKRRMLRRSRCMRLMLSRFTVRRFTEWSWLHALMICLHLSEIWRLLNWELGPIIWLWLMCKDSLLGNLDAWNQRSIVSQEIAPFLYDQIFQDEIVFNISATIRSLSEIVVPQLFIFDWSI